MPVGLAIALDRAVEGADAEAFAGHALNRARWELYEAAEEAGLAPLDEFVSLSADETEILAADLKFDTDPDQTTPAGWFDAADGLHLIRTLLTAVETAPDDIPDAASVLEELRTLNDLLHRATRTGARFRLSVAYE